MYALCQAGVRKASKPQCAGPQHPVFLIICSSLVRNDGGRDQAITPQHIATGALTTAT